MEPQSVKPTFGENTRELLVCIHLALNSHNLFNKLDSRKTSVFLSGRKGTHPLHHPLNQKVLAPDKKMYLLIHTSCHHQRKKNDGDMQGSRGVYLENSVFLRTRLTGHENVARGVTLTLPSERKLPSFWIPMMIEDDVGAGIKTRRGGMESQRVLVIG